MNKQISKIIKISVCTFLWSIAFAMTIGGVFRNEIRMMFGAGMTALVACIVTGWVVAEHAAQKACHEERVRLETLAQIAKDQADTRRGESGGGVTPIR